MGIRVATRPLQGIHNPNRYVGQLKSSDLQTYVKLTFGGYVKVTYRRMSKSPAEDVNSELAT